MLEQVQEVAQTSYNFLNIVASILLGAFGGVVKTIQEAKEDKSKFTGFRLLCNVCMSGFTALLVSFLLQDVAMADGLKTFLIGVCGWSGTGILSLTLRLIETYFAGRAGSTTKD